MTSPASEAMDVFLQVVGCGDAFGAGGRLQTCFLIDAPTRVLIDCGATALIGMKRYGIDPASIDMVVLTHLHGDHFGGLPFLLRETQVSALRKRPLVIVGPPGHEERILASTELLFPASRKAVWSFDLSFIPYEAHVPFSVKGVTVTAVPVVHSKATHPHGVRVECGGKVIAYSGDTEWIDELVSLSAGADLFICECYQPEPRIRHHIDLVSLDRMRSRLTAKALLLTHFGPEMTLSSDPAFPMCAQDGMRLRI
jgi:ribonuclease BN (tRNA processing enzyme)